MTRTKTPYLPTYCGRQSPGSVPHLPTYSQAAQRSEKIPVWPSVNRLPAPAAPACTAVRAAREPARAWPTGLSRRWTAPKRHSLPSTESRARTLPPTSSVAARTRRATSAPFRFASHAIRRSSRRTMTGWRFGTVARRLPACSGTTGRSTATRMLGNGFGCRPGRRHRGRRRRTRLGWRPNRRRLVWHGPVRG